MLSLVDILRQMFIRIAYQLQLSFKRCFRAQNILLLYLL